MKRTYFRFAALAAITTTSCFVAQSVFAIVDIPWNGANSTTWSDGLNWTGGTPAPTDNALFSSTFTNQPNLSGIATIGGIWMTGTPGQNVTISGSTLTISGSTINSIAGLGILVDNATANTLTISAPVTLGNAQTWRNTSGNLLTVSGNINTNGKALLIDGTGSDTLGGIISGSGPITLAGTGSSVITLSGTNTFTGALAIKSGTVSIAAFGQDNTDSPLGHSATAVTLGDTGGGTATIKYTGGNATGRSKTFTLATGGTGVFDITTAATSVGLTGRIDGSGGLTKNGPGTLTLTGSNTAANNALAYTGITTVNAGVLNIGTTTSTIVMTGGFAGAGTVQNNATNNNSFSTTGPINTFTGTFELTVPTGSGNQLAFNGTGTSLDGSNATFNIIGANKDTAGNRNPTLGSVSGTTFKIGGLNGVGLFRPGSISSGISSSINYEIGNKAGDYSYSGDIMEASNYTRVGGLTKVAGAIGTPSSQTLSGANSNYSGPTTISGGTLIVGANANSSRLIQKAPTLVDPTTDTFTVPNHGFSNGDRIVLDATTGPGGLSADQVTYFVTNSTPTTFQVEASIGGGVIDFTTAGSTDLAVEYGVAPDNVNDKIAITNHGFQNGDKVMLGIIAVGSAAIPGGLTSNKPYYVINKTDNDFQIALTSGGAAINFSSDGTAVFVTRPGALGAGNSAVVLGDGNTGSNDVEFATNGAFRVERAINVTNNGLGVATIGGKANANSIFSGAISLEKNLTVAQLATTGTNAMHITGGLSATTAGAKTITFGKTGFTGAVVVESTGITDGSGTVAVNVVGNKTTFSAINGYTGGTTINPGAGQGVLQFNSIDSVGGTGANVTANSGGVAAAGYAIDQAFINRVVSSSAGVVALATDSGNDLDFSGGGANLTAASLGASTSSTYSGTLTPNGTTYRLGGGGATLTVSSAAMSGAGNSLIVAVNGTSNGTVALSGQNTYGGGTLLNTGTLNIGADSTGTVTSGPIGTGTLTLNGGTLGSTSGGDRTVANTVFVPATSTTSVRSASSSDTLILSGPITGTGTFQASTSVNSGVVLTGDLSGFQGTLAHTASVSSSATLQLGGTTAESQNASQAHLILSGSTSGAARQLRFGASGIPTTRFGELAGTGGQMNPNAGLTPITLEVGNLVTGANFSAFSGSLFNSANSTAGSEVSLRKLGTGTLILSGTNSYDGTTTVSAGTLVAGADVRSTAMTPYTPLDTPTRVNGSTDRINLTGNTLKDGDRVLIGGVSADISATNLTASTPYYVRNRTANDFQVSTTLAGAILGLNSNTDTDPDPLVVTRATAFGSSTSPIVLNDGGTGNEDVNLAIGGAFTMERQVTVAANAGTGVTSIGALTNNNSTFSGLVTVNKNLTVGQFATTGGNALHVTGGITSGGGNQTITFGKTGFFGDVKVETTGISNGSGTLAVDVNNPGYTVTFSAANTYTGDTKVSAGTLSTGLVNNLADAADVYLTTGAIFNLNFLGTDTIDSLFFNNVLQASGTWGATGSGALNINDAFFTGTGLLAVTTGAGGLLGDYNGNNVVDSADYVLWRRGGIPVAANDATPGSNDASDYDVWRAHFGNSLPPGSGSGSNSLTGSGSVPEPSTIALVVCGFALLIGRRNAGRR